MIADAAEAITNGFKSAFGYKSNDEFTRIMCWAHVLKAVEKRVKDIKEKEREEILEDIISMQTAHNKEMFKLLQELFFKKWADRDTSIDKFLDYFEKEWINSHNCNWYEGAALNIPSTDNGLESNNGVIKLVHTLRQRMAVNVYLNSAVSMFRNWPKDRLDEKLFKETLDISDELWEYTYLFLYKGESKNIVSRKRNTNEYVIQLV